MLALVAATLALAAAQGEDRAVPTAPAWRYVHSVERDPYTNQPVYVEHEIVAKAGQPNIFGGGEGFRLEFSCSASGGTEGPKDTPLVPSAYFSMSVTCLENSLRSSDCDTRWRLELDRGAMARVRDANASFSRGNLEVRVDAKPILTLGVSLSRYRFPRSGLVYDVEDRYWITMSKMSLDRLARYIRGGHLIKVRMQGGGRQTQEADISGVDAAVSYLTEQCAERQQMVYPRHDPDPF